MARFVGGALKRSLERNEQLLTLFGSERYGGRGDFSPTLHIASAFYEDAGNYDNQIIFLGVQNYNRKTHRREKNHSIGIGFCLLLDMATALRKYNSVFEGTRELGMLMEFPGAGKRIGIFQEHGSIVLRLQLFRGLWTGCDTISVKPYQISTFQKFFRAFINRNLDNITKSIRRNKEKNKKWLTTPV